MSRFVHRFSHIDRAVTTFMAQAAIPLLRISLAITYIWFGALKLFDVSPVADLVAKTLPFLPRHVVLRTLGTWEVAIGTSLLLRLERRLTLLLFFSQLTGTFLTLIVRRRDTFKDGNPLLLTQDGEFVIKNLVLLAAGIAVGSTARRDSEQIHDSQGQPTP